MKRIILLMIFLSVATNCFAIWLTSSLESRVKHADLIVVGTLTSIEPKRFSITYHDYYMSPIEKETKGDRDYIFHYNAGLIQVERVLKGSWSKDFVPFACYGGAETEEGGTKKTAVFFDYEDLSYSEGQSGVWILQTGGNFLHWYGTNYPGNLLPNDSIPVIERIIESCKK